MLARWSRHVCSIALRSKTPREIPYRTSSLPDHQPGANTTTRSFGSNKKRKKRRQNKKSGRFSGIDEKRRRKDLLRHKGLHLAAQWKRVLSATDYWFSEANLLTDEFLRTTLWKHHGWIPVSVLLTFPKFHYWTSEQLLVDAFSSSAAKRFPLIYSRKLCQHPQSIRGSGQSRQSAPRLEPLSTPSDDAGSSSDERPETTAHDGSALEDSDATGDDDESFADEDDDLYDWGSKPDEDDDLYDWGSTPDDEDDIRVYAAPTVPRALEANKGRNDVTFRDTDHNTTEPYHMDEACADDDRAFINPFQLDDVIDTEQDVKYALVTHRRITKELLESLERGGTEDESDVDEEGEETPKEAEVEKPMVGSRTTKRYSTERSVHIVKKASQLPAVCKDLDASTRAFAKRMAGNDNNGQDNACAIGMDVEYCTLEFDIRNTLPALIQLSSPDPEGPVVLIWIDKFPDHGKTMLSDADCGPLIELLSDPTLLKVGVGVTKDADHLAKWWDLTKKDKQLVFGGLAEIADETGKAYSLQELCYSKLGLKLLKMKDLDAKKKRDRKRKGKRVKTSHWRVQGMTPDMRQYAVNDAACSIDVWKEIHGFRVHGDSHGRKTVINEEEMY